MTLTMCGETAYSQRKLYEIPGRIEIYMSSISAVNSIKNQQAEQNSWTDSMTIAWKNYSSVFTAPSNFWWNETQTYQAINSSGSYDHLPSDRAVRHL